MSTPSTPEAPPRRVDGSMSLLNDMMANTLDEAYAERAARRAGQAQAALPAQEQAREPRGRRATALLVLVALGVMTGTAVAQVRARQQADTGLRAGLADEVRERTAQTDLLAVQAEQLRLEVAAEEAEVLGVDAEGRVVAERLRALGLGSATVPVQGPGVVVQLDDAPRDAAGERPLRGGSLTSDRVQDRDLQAVANALKAAGAEALSINGQRLTALSAIRSAGDTVLVDFKLLTPPYVVEAIGDPSRLEVELLDGQVGRTLTTYVARYGLGFSVRREQQLTLPGAPTPQLRAVDLTAVPS